MAIPLLLSGPTGRGETMKELIEEHKRQVSILRQTTAPKATIEGEFSRNNSIQPPKASISPADDRIRSDRVTPDAPAPGGGRIRSMLGHGHRGRSTRLWTTVPRKHSHPEHQPSYESPATQHDPVDRNSADSARAQVNQPSLLDAQGAVVSTTGHPVDSHPSSRPPTPTPWRIKGGCESTAFPVPTYPITRTFRACAEFLVTPLGKEFVLDPPKVGSPSLLMEPTIPSPTQEWRGSKVRMLDLGGLETDAYTIRLAETTGCNVHKAVVESLSRKASRLDARSFHVEVTADLAVLPYPDTSFNIVSARSLHKDIQAGLGKPETPNEKWKCMRDCLAECNRILIPGGRLEYIYFEDEITNGGPLTTEMQPFLQEVWGPGFDDDTANSSFGSCPSNVPGISTQEFSDLLIDTGFQGGKVLVTYFQLLTLCKLFDHRGCNRAGKWNSGSGADISRLHPSSPLYASYNDQAQRLLTRIREECQSRRSGWKCLIGWATKGSSATPGGKIGDRVYTRK